MTQHRVEPDYRPEFAAEARELCCNGAELMGIAKHFHVAPITALGWAQEYPDFAEAMRCTPWTLERAAVERAVSPERHAASVVRTFGDRTDDEVPDDDLLLAALYDSAHDAEYSERALLAQAHALDAVFASLAQRAARQDGLAQYQAFMKLALRAQNQSRMTLETLATIKNPPVVFAKQANIAAQQQVNIGPAARETEKIAPDEVSRIEYEQPLDARTLPAAGASDSPLEAVDAQHRPAHR